MDESSRDHPETQPMSDRIRSLANHLRQYPQDFNRFQAVASDFSSFGKGVFPGSIVGRQATNASVVL